MKGRLAFGFAVLGMILTGAAPTRAPVDYTVGIAGPHQLEVEMRFAGDADGETRIDLPDHWAGTDELWRGVSGFHVEGGTAAGDGQVRIIRHRPGVPLIVRYRVASGGPGMDPSGEKARPTVEPDWFFFHGEGVFASVDGRESAPVRFRWGALPAGWRVASDLDRLPKAGGRLDDLVESASLGGRDVQVATRSFAGAPLTVAVQGKWNFAPADLLARVGRILTAEHDYWGERPAPFLVTLAPLPPLPAGGMSYTGTGRGDAFSLLSTPGFDLVQATRVLAHEYMHHWVPRLLGGMRAKEEARDYWLSEGFDDYLTARVLLRSGIWALPDWLANKNEVLLRYAMSPARRATGAEIAAGFWKDENVERISYDRGHLLALLLDARIRAATGGRASLDDVLRAQRRAARRGGPTAASLLPETVRRIAGIDIRPDLERWAVRGEPFGLPGGIAPACLAVRTETRHGFTRGFDAEATAAANLTIKGVDPAGPAYAAGMRDGMILVKREAGTIGDAAREIAYRVQDGGRERVIRYLPAARETFEVQQLAPTAAAATPACRRILAGTP